MLGVIKWSSRRDLRGLSQAVIPNGAMLGGVQVKLETWNLNVFGHVGKKIAQLQKELEWLEKQPSSQVTNKNLRETKEKLNCWLDKENAMWKQRARLNWFQGGDRNTGFFHAKASSRFKKNMIEGVCDASGVWREEGDFIERVFVDYYAELFKSLNPSDFSEVVEAV